MDNVIDSLAGMGNEPVKVFARAVARFIQRLYSEKERMETEGQGVGMTYEFGNTLLIANPAARSGRGAQRIDQAEAELQRALPAGAFTLAITERPHHAKELAAAAQDFHTVLALGGDGLVNEVANGLMEHDAARRPVLGVIPAGSGNDYGRAIGISTDPVHACEQLLGGTARPVDVGRVNDRWFVETLSFGLDAAIALETTSLRERTKRRGSLLYLESGFDQLFHHLRTWDYTASFDGGEGLSGESVTFAVQLGPYYGGGFKICPAASLDDGTFSICIAHPPVSLARAVLIFLCAKGGHHRRFAQMEFRQARTVHVEFAEAPPAQVDGEQLTARTFDIAIEPGALRVIHPT